MLDVETRHGDEILVVHIVDILDCKLSICDELLSVLYYLDLGVYFSVLLRYGRSARRGCQLQATGASIVTYR